jgi:transcriptional regulator with GAF, ATPase, and Fis domain
MNRRTQRTFWTLLRARVPAGHLSIEVIIEALQAAHGVIADAARRLGSTRVRRSWT